MIQTNRHDNKKIAQLQKNLNTYRQRIKKLSKDLQEDGEKL